MAHLGVEINNNSPKSPAEMVEMYVQDECVSGMCRKYFFKKLRVHCLNIGLEKALDCKVV